MKKFIIGLVVGGALATLAAVYVMGTSSITQKDINNEMVNAILWMQTSAEYRALCYQAYNSALERVAAASNMSTDKPLAIILDCDETVIDNSPANAVMIDNDGTGSGLLSAWSKAQKAEAMPGASEFLNAVDALGVDIFYVTNRNERMRDDTMSNMKALNFPQVDDEHTVFKSEESSKDSRFSRISSKYNVVVYLGDSAHDFPMNIYGKNMAERNAITDANKELFGMKYIVLPNPIYGSWLAVTGGSGAMSPAERHKAKVDALNIWKDYRP